MSSSYSHLPLLLSDDLYLHPICELILIMFGGGGQDARCTARNGCYNIVFISAYNAVTNFYIISSHLWRVLGIVLCGGLVGWLGLQAGEASRAAEHNQYWKILITSDDNILTWARTANETPFECCSLSFPWNTFICSTIHRVISTAYKWHGSRIQLNDKSQSIRSQPIFTTEFTHDDTD